MTNKSEYNIEHILQVMIKPWTWLVSWHPYCQQGWKQYCLYLGVHTINKAENKIVCILASILSTRLTTILFASCRGYGQIIWILALSANWSSIYICTWPCSTFMSNGTFVFLLFQSEFTSSYLIAILGYFGKVIEHTTTWPFIILAW